MIGQDYQNAFTPEISGLPCLEWIETDDGLYSWAMNCQSGEQFADELEACGITSTPDGTRLTRGLVINAWERLQ